MLGNTLLILTSLCLFGLINITSSPMPGGDRGMGYGLMLFFCGVGFAIFSGLLAWNLSARGHFDWISEAGSQRGWLVFFGWAALAAATFFSAAFRNEWHAGEFPEFLRWFSKSLAVVWLPLLLLWPAFWLLNFRQDVVPNFVQISMKTGFVLSILMGLGLLFGMFRASAQNAANREADHKAQNDARHNEHLRRIAEQKLSDPILNILALTGRFHDAEVRDAAIAKVKSHPDWEAELIRLLNETEWQSEVYQFIDGNAVDHPELFVEPIKTSLRWTAAEIKRRIKNANNLQDWHMEHFSIERCLRAIDEQFSKVPGADFRAEVRELLAALETPKPERFQKVNFTLTPVVKAWLKKHE